MWRGLLEQLGFQALEAYNFNVLRTFLQSSSDIDGYLVASDFARDGMRAMVEIQALRPGSKMVFYDTEGESGRFAAALAAGARATIPRPALEKEKLRRALVTAELIDE
jgi:DNA-binding NarL/FixJ family response regulator